ncbi:hypothetical protein C8R47DRAFT_934527, partial [Mycena vitilis]
PPPPPRVRRTHKSVGVIQALKKLPRTLKQKMNLEIAERNGTRSLKHVAHLEDRAANPTDASDDESLITVSDASV